MASSECDKEDATKIGVIGALSTDLEIGILETNGSTLGSTLDLMPPSMEFVDILLFSDISPPSCLAHSNKPPIIVILIRARNYSNIQLLSLLCKSGERKVIVVKSSHYQN